MPFPGPRPRPSPRPASDVELATIAKPHDESASACLRPFPGPRPRPSPRPAFDSERRAFLLGDAAHVHSPVGGQGMNTGIGDAVNLAWKLAAVVKGEAAETILDTYEPERIPFARRLVASTDRAFTIATSRGRLARLVRTRLAPPLLATVFRLPGWGHFVFRTISQIAIRYRQSPLSEGIAGALKGGDRLPWIETASSDNFASLSALRWQVHIYGEAHKGLDEACTRLNLPLTTFPWTPKMKRAGLTRNALYLLRPDGYIALCDSTADPTKLAAYLAKHNITPKRAPA